MLDSTTGMWDGKADDAILDVYSDKRREKWQTIIDPVSQENFRRVSDSDPDTLLQRDPVMQACKKAENDPALQRAAFLAGFALRYDFTQHFKTE